MDDIKNISNEIIQISVGVIGLLFAIGLAVAALEGQINALMGIPTQNYKGKLFIFILILAIAVLAVPISQTISNAVH